LKLKAGQVEAFLARPKPEVATVLLYGPDAGLVAERARRLGAMVAGALDDPFRVSELDPDLLEREPQRLVEEAQALCLMGGHRLVRVRDATDRVTEACRQLVAVEAQAGFVVIEAADLRGGSKLLRLVEGARTAAALPCYRQDERSLPVYVRETLGELGLRVEAEALAYFTANLGGDKAVTRAELEKLALYMLDRPGRPVRREDAAAIVGDSAAVEIDDLVRAALAGERKQLDRALDRLLAEGTAPQRLLGACTRTLTQMLRLHADAAGGRPGIPNNLPPAQRAFLDRHLRAWTPDRTLAALGRLQDAEIRCRTPRAPEALICREVLATLVGGRRNEA
jgi:DNA polymerase-3 subunit delta